MLFPDLPADQGRARIEAAIAGAADAEAWERIERIAAEPDMLGDLVTALRRLKADPPAPGPSSSRERRAFGAQSEELG
jgi:hypothetical protein